MTTGLNYWGPHFPDAAGGHFWGPHFPDGVQDPSVVVGVGPAGVATLGLSLVDTTKLTLSWLTDVIKSYSGLESRIAVLDLPKQSLAGTAFLVGSDVLTQRARLARYAAQGQPFLVGLPFEALPLTANASGVTVNVTSTTFADWAVIGQRVLVVSSDGATVVQAVVQSFTSTTFVLDVAPGSAGNLGGSIMPAVPVLLDPQQGFARYPNPGSVETWAISGRVSMFGFQNNAVKAFAKLSAATAGAFHNATAVYSQAGTVGNGVTLQFIGDSISGSSLVAAFPHFTFHFQSGINSVANAQAALAPYGITFTGTLNPLAFLVAPNDAFGPVTLAGGVDKLNGVMGAGATVTTYEGRPVWDRGVPLVGGDTSTDSIQSMVELVDMNGIPFEVGTGTTSDWGREVAIERTSVTEWQWLKAFLSTVRGRQRAWWYATWRADLTPVQLTPGALKVSSTIGDPFAWYPTLRTHLQLVAVGGSVQYLDISSATDNGDGTLTFAIASSNAAYNLGGGGATLSAGSIALVSWLDLCRFESDDFDVEWSGFTFSLKSQARAVTQ